MNPGGGPGARPPAIVRLLLRILLPREEREFFLGDLEESRRHSWPREILGALWLRVGARAGLRRRRASGGDGKLHELTTDLRYGLRMMARSPGFTAVALATMALGIGANTAMFSIVHGVILKPLPYPGADRIVYLRANNLERGWSSFSIAPLNFWDWQKQSRSLDAMAAYRRRSVVYTGGERPQMLQAYLVSDRFLDILGGEPTLGRGITKKDLEPDAPDVVLLTHGFWARFFGSDPDVLGHTITLDGTSHTVVGVLPRGWRAPSQRSLDIIEPLKPQPFWYTARDSHFLYAVGRLGSGMTVARAQADLSTVASGLAARYPDTNKGWGVSVRPLRDAMVGSARTQLFVLMASVGLVLLIACANLANMTLARAAGRTRELAIRTAVGASRARVIRQLLAESVVLSLTGGALGIALAYGALGALVAGWPTMLPRTEDIRIDGMVLLFSLVLSMASAVLFGLVPAVGAAGTNTAASLGRAARSVTGDRSRRWMRAMLVAGEVGMAVVLLVGTGLLVRSFAALQGEDPGFRTNGRLVLSTPLPGAKYHDPQNVDAFTEAVLARLRTLPGVESAAVSSLIPLSGSDEIWGYWLEGHGGPGSQADGAALFYRVGPGYFKAMGIPLRAGRAIAAADRRDTPPVAVISASLAEQSFPGVDPMGRILKFGRDDDEPAVRIVGIVGDVRHYNLGRTSMPQVYVPLTQHPTGGVHFVLAASVPPGSLAAAVRKAVAEVDPDQPAVGIETADQMVSGTIAMPRFRTLLMSLFGMTALLLAVVGLYGVLAYSVSQRTREIGVRLALGATRPSVLRLVLREGLPLVGVGLVTGLAGALALSRILKSMLFGVSTLDPVVFAAVPLVLAAVAFLAMLVPARRATKVDPVRALGESGA